MIRHGETQWNLEKRTQGHLDSPLSEKGVLQTKETAQKLRNYKFDLVLSSPLGRALETAKIISAELGTNNIQMEPDLAERHLGVLQGRTKKESLENYPHFFGADGRFIQSSDIPEAESLQDFLQRIQQAVLKLQILSEDSSMLVITHDGVLHAMLGCIKDISFDKVQNFSDLTIVSRYFYETIFAVWEI